MRRCSQEVLKQGSQRRCTYERIFTLQDLLLFRWCIISEYLQFDSSQKSTLEYYNYSQNNLGTSLLFSGCFPIAFPSEHIGETPII